MFKEMYEDLRAIFAPPPRPNLMRESRQTTSITLGILAVMLIGSIVTSILAALVNLFAPELLQEGWFVLIVSTFPMYIVGLPLALFLFAIGTKQAPEKKSIPFSSWLGILAICFVLMLLGSYIGQFINIFIEMIIGVQQSNAVADMTQDVPMWANLLCVGIAAPIFEEIIYRKLVIDRLSRYGDRFAVLASGLIFGLIHGNFSQFFYAAIIGIVLGLVYVQTGKLRYTIALHMVLNIIGGVYTVEMSRFLEHLEVENPTNEAMMAGLPGIIMLIGYYAFMFACLVGAPIAIIKLRNKIKLRKPDVKLSASQMTRIWTLNPAVWILFLMTLWLFITSAMPV